MKCLKNMDELFKMAVILQYDKDGFIPFFADSGKIWWLTSTSLWFVSIHKVPPKNGTLLQDVTDSDPITAYNCKVSSFSIYFWGFLYIQYI